MKSFISSAFWSDPDIEVLDPGEKLAVLWLWTNAQMNICGFCEVSAKRFAFDTGLAGSVLDSALSKLPNAFARFGHVVYSRNFMRHQIGSGPKMARNNIFKSALAIVEALTDSPLRNAIFQDYPEFLEALGSPYQALGSPSEGFENPRRGKGKVKERVRDQDLEGGAGGNLESCEMHTEPELPVAPPPEAPISDLGRDAEKIRMAYPRQGDVPHAQAAILRALRHGEHAEGMLAQTLACAFWVRKLMDANALGYIPGAKAFWEGQQWKDEAKFKGIWQSHEEKTKQQHEAHQQRSGGANAPGRYARKPEPGGPRA